MLGRAGTGTSSSEAVSILFQMVVIASCSSCVGYRIIVIARVTIQCFSSG